MNSAASVNWQDEAWTFLEKVGELQYFVSWRAWSASRCRLVPSALDDQGAPTGSLDPEDPNAEKVLQIVNDIGGGASGQSKLVRRTAYLLSVVGECWVGLIVRNAAREETTEGNSLPVDLSRPGYQLEQWYVFGREQITQSSSTIELKLPDGTKHTFDPNVDILFRVWDEHPKDPSQPVSPIWSNRDVLAGIVQSDLTIKAANNSRLVGNGIMFVPQEMSLPDQPAPMAVPVGEPDTNDPVPYFEPNQAQKLQDLLFDVATAAKRDPESQAAMLPVIAAVPGELIKNVMWLRPGSDVPETTLKIQEADIRRLAMGLDTAPERLLGMSQGNHWSAWAIDDNDVKIHIAPVVEIIANALTQEILRQKLVEEGLDPDAYVIWYDATSLAQDPDKTDEARDAFDRGALTARALREHLGFDEDDGYDLENADGWIEMALDKIAQDPANAQVFMPIIEAAAKKVGLEVAAAQQPALPAGQDPNQQDQPSDGPPPEPQTTPAETPPPQSQTAAITVARLCTNRALELANKRRRGRADAHVLRETPIELAHTVLGPVEQAEVPRLISGWDTGVSDEDLKELGLDPRTFRGLVEGVATISLITASAPVLTQSMIRRAV
jgi:hypothetical protein